MKLTIISDAFKYILRKKKYGIYILESLLTESIKLILRLRLIGVYIFLYRLQLPFLLWYRINQTKLQEETERTWSFTSTYRHLQVQKIKKVRNLSLRPARRVLELQDTPYYSSQYF
ncbi:hypothetical protein PHYBLDRAFT_166826 [Phycomyces blakesleeanus NRRL 1555(-)]|uniref:Uncharacterized protein n=1 Tax=Phycomyces blakesleeanus (strain ATCC 8743b / DSM 1359 / FGSC 10004 / NBRC 33097 / NRRL 1555) TaxID=763407 RepID=A0A162XLN6_PHYB8|nr:hypothetical protein PHYBLDRAFT_166826 [Phycomyces blakesleeanus NRRL 1555(-)]OAD75595.1 hypothetical protein PHYBLDRAFT_166826 [Phycomyces blakesleeanus NRRL 1555(-)]|eukprot:XP_018293635.1 hypothetical protein PHYBLDRAFT_166826 [Phycomyces blakesleeanus NRRL 1555(-)]